MNCLRLVASIPGLSSTHPQPLKNGHLYYSNATGGDGIKNIVAEATSNFGGPTFALADLISFTVKGYRTRFQLEVSLDLGLELGHVKGLVWTLSRSILGVLSLYSEFTAEQLAKRMCCTILYLIFTCSSILYRVALSDTKFLSTLAPLG